ncbi:MAG: SLBB domain-containing protein [Candidatus Zixiibacteriota bacterium]
MRGTAAGQAIKSPDSAMISFAPTVKEYDEPVNPDLFLIRPAEKLTVTFVGAKFAPLAFTIDPEGRIVDNTMGVVSVAGLTLAEAREKLVPILKKLYNSQSIEISVASPREVAIHIAGAVVRPWLYRAYMSQHVSEIVALAGGVTEEGSRRRIEFRGGAKPLTVDLDRAEYLADGGSNPYIYAGNSIFVPVRSQDVVSVVGEVAKPRSIEFLIGDDLATLILLAGGTTHFGDANKAYILNGDGPLQTGSTVVVPPIADSYLTNGIQVFGAIRNPGKYSLPTPATLGTAISLAKDMSSSANAGRITVFRTLPPDEWGALSAQRYAISTADASGKLDLSVPLQVGDSIFVPARTTVITIEGEVALPGTYLYSEGKNADFYIAMAGGLLPNADQTHVMMYDRITRRTSRQSPGVIVRDGDRIIVAKDEAFR